MVTFKNYCFVCRSGSVEQYSQKIQLLEKIHVIYKESLIRKQSKGTLDKSEKRKGENLAKKAKLGKDLRFNCAMHLKGLNE